MESQGLCGEVLMKRKAGRERLSILKFTKDFKKNSPVRWQELIFLIMFLSIERIKGQSVHSSILK